MTNEKSLQEEYAPESICFGCGPSNSQGLKIRSFAKAEKVVATWKPKPEHQAFPGVLNGGIIGALLDCHCNWTAAWHLKKRMKAEKVPCTVTAEYSIKLLKPTPADKQLDLTAWVVESTDDRALVEGTLSVDGKVCASCKGTFVAVKPGHPAYHRWG